MLGPTDALHALVRPAKAIVTVAILAQGTSWADAVTQAFWSQARIPPATLHHKVNNISKKPNPQIGEHLILLNADRRGSFQENFGAWRRNGDSSRSDQSPSRRTHSILKPNTSVTSNLFRVQKYPIHDTLNEKEDSRPLREPLASHCYRKNTTFCNKSPAARAS